MTARNPYVCEIHGPTPNPLCHVQQARQPIRSIEISPAESHRNLVTGCAFTLAAAIVAIGLWIALVAWLLG